MWVPYVLEAIVCSVVVFYFLQQYISFRKTRKAIYFSASLGYFLSFFILFLLPNDISVAIYERCVELGQTTVVGNATVPLCAEPVTYAQQKVLVATWNAIYWTTFVCTWLVYPILQSYSYNGGFTVWSRIKGAIRENIIFYGVVGIIFGGIFIWIAILKRSIKETYGIAMTMSNVWGLFILICMLGIGLVEIPRRIWRRGNYALNLRYRRWLAQSLRDEMDTSNEELEKTLKAIKYLDEDTRDTSIEREYVDKLVDKARLLCKEDYTAANAGHNKVSTSYSDLVKLHAKLMRYALQTHQNKCLYQDNLRRAYQLEDILRARDNGQSTIKWSFLRTERGAADSFKNKLISFWLLFVSAWFWRVLAVICGMLSVILLWSEVTFGFFPKVSLFSIILRTGLYSIGLELLVFACVLYMAVCAFSSLFRLRLFNYYRLLPHKHSDENSILFSAAYLCRLGPPLALNFVVMARLEEKVGPNADAFLKVMGQMNVVPKLGEQFYIYFPICLALICMFTAFNLSTRIANCFKFGSQFQYDEDVNDDQVQQGQELIALEKDILLKQQSRRPVKFDGSDTQSANKNLPLVIQDNDDEPVPLLRNSSSNGFDDVPDNEPIELGPPKRGFFSKLFNRDQTPAEPIGQIEDIESAPSADANTPSMFEGALPPRRRPSAATVPKKRYAWEYDSDGDSM